MSERFNVFTHPGVPHCRKCLLNDFCGALPKRLREVMEDMSTGNIEGLQCDECSLDSDEFFEFIEALYIGALLGDDMEGV